MATRTDSTLARVAGLTFSIGMLIVAVATARPGLAGITRSDDESAELLARPLTADSAARIAVARQSRLRAAVIDVDSARARHRQAALLPNPELKVDLRRAPGSSDPDQADIEAEIELGSLLTMPVRRAITRAQVEAAQHAASRTRVQIEHEARSAFYAVQVAEARWRSAVVALEIAVAARDAARSLHAAGNVTSLALANHIAASETERLIATEAELAYHAAREMLQQRLGLHGSETDWQISSDVDELVAETPDLSELERSAVEASHDLARQHAEHRSLVQTGRLEQMRGWLPGLAVDFHAERDDTRWETGGGFRVDIPLFDRRQGETAALRADALALESRRRAAAIDLRSRARELRNRLVTADARARHWRDNVLTSYRRVVEEALLQHNAMQLGVFDLLEVRRAALEAERAAVDAHFDALLARCELDALVEGVLLGSTESSENETRNRPIQAGGGH